MRRTTQSATVQGDAKVKTKHWWSGAAPLGNCSGDSYESQRTESRQGHEIRAPEKKNRVSSRRTAVNEEATGATSRTSAPLGCAGSSTQGNVVTASVLNLLEAANGSRVHDTSVARSAEVQRTKSDEEKLDVDIAGDPPSSRLKLLERFLRNTSHNRNRNFV